MIPFGLRVRPLNAKVRFSGGALRTPSGRKGRCRVRPLQFCARGKRKTTPKGARRNRDCVRAAAAWEAATPATLCGSSVGRVGSPPAVTLWQATLFCETRYLLPAFRNRVNVLPLSEYITACSVFKVALCALH